MKSIIYLSVIISAAWSYLAFPSNSILDMIINTYKYQLVSVTWTLVIIYFYDFIMAMFKKSSHYMIEFHQSLRGEFIVLLALFVFSCIIYKYTPQEFTNSTLDICMAGFGFVVMGNLSIFKLFKYRIGRVKFPKRIPIVLSVISVLLSAYFLKLTLNVARGEYNFYQSLWVQITVLCFSISFFFWSKHICFIMQKGKIEISPVLKGVFSKFKLKYDFYEQAEIMSVIWNKESEKEKTKYNAELRRMHKKRKFKRS
ncbi:Uncharacterised protein [Yersinia aldovae]|uniref:hypothetical protein n=1 Tax=Yersinia aldovae TaxID=29483 RepID=UPI0005E218C2|nr:hypothetical protein [Yersinia aldovae]CNH85188.1 Uncharacterised protein [Yersinia aldovae]